MRLKGARILLALAMALVFLFLFTRPDDYRRIYRDVAGTLEDQWCAWAEPFGHRCDRWRKVRSALDEARELGEEIKDSLPAIAPVEDARRSKD